MSRLASVARPSLCLALLVLVCTPSDAAGQTANAKVRVDREYTLESTMVGYRGVGGEIDGVRNPTLWARTGETVRIGIVNGELMVHDIALENLGVKSQQILDKGATTGITFKAERSDTYYCTLPGHRLAGMVGRLDVSDEPRTSSEGVAPTRDERPLNLDFEAGTLNHWTPAGDAFSLVKANRKAPELKDAREGEVGSYWASSRPGGSARRGTLSSVPFVVSHPFASFLLAGGAFSRYANRARRGRGWPAVLQHLRRRSGRAAAGSRRPQAPGRQVDLHPTRGR